tara:strand:- start:2566 stop:2829 length:264 start_codon:yes stop_codon:yes gene_type:complete
MFLFKKFKTNFNFLLIIFLRSVLKKIFAIKKKIVAAIACDNAIIKVDKIEPNIYPDTSINGDIKPSNKTQIITKKEKTTMNIILLFR